MISGEMLSNNGCLKLHEYGYELSIAFDNSCNIDNIIRRADIRLYVENEDITSKVFPNMDTIIFCGINMTIILEYMKNNSRI